MFEICNFVYLDNLDCMEQVSKLAELPEPWYWSDNDFTGQLNIEIKAGHLLWGKAVKTIARRQDNDDVLFELEKDEFKYAVVHLTWSRSKQENSNYPKTRLFKDWGELYTNCILPDSQNW